MENAGACAILCNIQSYVSYQQKVALKGKTKKIVINMDINIPKAAYILSHLRGLTLLKNGKEIS